MNDEYLGPVSVEHHEQNKSESDVYGVGFIGDQQFGDLWVFCEDHPSAHEVGLKSFDVCEICPNSLAGVVHVFLIDGGAFQACQIVDWCIDRLSVAVVWH